MQDLKIMQAVIGSRIFTTQQSIEQYNIHYHVQNL